MTTSSSTDSSRPIGRRATRWAGTLVFHGLAVAIVFVVLLLVLAGADRLAQLLGLFAVSEFASQALPSVAVHLGVAAGVWTLMYGVGRRLWRRRDHRRHRLVRLGRGTVLVETLIVFPVMLTLILGLAQLAINSTAAVLSQLAAYESARTVWLWQPETNRYDLEDEDIERKGRLQAAAVMAPVALSYSPDELEGDEHDRFREMRGAIVAGQRGLGGSDGLQEAEDVTEEASAAYGTDMEVHSLIGALDGTDYAARSALKLNGAYAATEIELLTDEGDDDNRIGVEMSYHHYQNIPLVGRIFGDHYDEDSAPGDYSRPGNYSEYNNAFTLPEQPTPHEDMPN